MLVLAFYLWYPHGARDHSNPGGQTTTGLSRHTYMAMLDILFEMPIIPELDLISDGCVFGLVYFEMNQNDLDILNLFEGEIYELRLVRAVLISGVSEPTITYVIKEQFEDLLTEQDWNLEKFNSLHKDNFLRDYHGFNQS